MTIQEILNTSDHRPWKIPPEGWKFYQEWNNTIFLHWQVELNELKKFVPQELEIDLFDGKPWISVVAFTMEKIRPKNLPSFPPISDFDEINIRTYVKSNSKTGVYFLSIEGGKSLSCKIAKGMSELPYRFSKMERTENEYSSTNSEFNDYLRLGFKIGEKINEKEELDKWLTERYALFQDTDKSINAFEIHHLEWEINEIELQKLEFNYPRFKNLIKGKPDKVQYSDGVQVVAWGKHSAEKTGYNKT
ncbi:YqjF family protein [Maribacter sp. 2307UL18-2]|uniref:YqjF family protein n=1 Tax=Maribacter sp. 2307UL18-2 TaxID=3386274 RepID=UPI0039BCBC43